MQREIDQLLEQSGRPPPRDPIAPPQGTAPPASSLEERIRRDPPPQGAFRFYNTAFKMPGRPGRGPNK